MPLFPLSGVAAPTYHPPEELLLDYAAGANTAAEAMMIATHLACCPKCRSDVRVAVDAGGALLDALTPVRLPPDMLNRTLAAIDQLRTETTVPEVPTVTTLLNRQFAANDWRTLPGGFRMRRVSGDDRSGGGRVWLFDAPPGMKLLPHRHRGDEWTVILRGQFVDNDLCLKAGDFGRLADGVVHNPTVGPSERCVSLIMVRQDPRYTTLLGKLSAPFVRL